MNTQSNGTNKRREVGLISRTPKSLLAVTSLCTNLGMGGNPARLLPILKNITRQVDRIEFLCYNCSKK